MCVFDLCTHGNKSQQKSSWDFTKKLMQMPNPFIISLVMCHCPLWPSPGCKQWTLSLPVHTLVLFLITSSPLHYLYVLWHQQFFLLQGARGIALRNTSIWRENRIGPEAVWGILGESCLWQDYSASTPFFFFQLINSIFSLPCAFHTLLLPHNPSD